MSICGLLWARTGKPVREGGRYQSEDCPALITTIPKPFTSAETSLDIGSPPLRWLNMSANMGRFAQQRKGFSKLPHSGPTRDAWLWDYK